MRILKCLIISTLFLSSSNVFSQTTRYLDIEDDQVVSVFNSPGNNWKTCSDSKSCKAIAWPDNSATLKILGPAKKIKTLNPYTDKLVEEEYLPVEYEYKRLVNGKIYHQKGQGWIDAAYTSTSKNQAFYTKSPLNKNPLDCKCPPGKICNKETESLRPITESLSNQSVVQDAEVLEKIIGDCALQNPKAPRFASGNPYDAHILPKLKNKTLPKIRREDGALMTHEDLINSDALARTIYGEMASCFKHGLHYPMTVARICVNRADNTPRHGEFIRGPHASGKGHLAQVVTTPSQFSVWNKTDSDGNVNGPLLMAMCPPQQEGKKYWKSGSAPRDESDIWKNAVKIATEATLFPNRFKNRTIKVNQFFYTSGLGAFYNMNQVNPSIDGRKVSRDSCVEVWQE